MDEQIDTVDEQIDTTILIVMSQIRTNMKPDEVLKVSQAVLNLAHARELFSRKK